MSRLREKFQRFMMGRYGADHLSQFMVWVVLILIVINVLVRGALGSTVLSILELAVLVTLYMRMFSKNVGKRSRENQVFLGMRFYVKEHWKRLKSRFAGRREFRVFKCPRCRQKIRIPRGHGKVSIHCPKCGADFIKKT